MSKYIAVAGKGGVGKTTFTALLLRQMVHRKKGLQYSQSMQTPMQI